MPTNHSDSSCRGQQNHIAIAVHFCNFFATILAFSGGRRTAIFRLRGSGLPLQSRKNSPDGLAVSIRAIRSR